MNKKAVVAVILVIVAVLAVVTAYKKGIFDTTTDRQVIPDTTYEVPDESQNPASSDPELESIDTGANLDSDFQSADSDIQAL